jgi:peptide-methionine (R)-S-oxide reductase
MLRSFALAALVLLAACSDGRTRAAGDAGQPASPPVGAQAQEPGGAPAASTAGAEEEKVSLTEEEWRERLTPEQYQICRECGTEPAFTGKYWDTKTDGTYHCVGCGQLLFDSQTKYDSGSGWPSFWEPASESAVATREDRKLGMVRTEILCSKCDAHLGHVFRDGPRPTGLRYCVNSASLDLQERKPAR